MDMKSNDDGDRDHFHLSWDDDDAEPRRLFSSCGRESPMIKLAWDQDDESNLSLVQAASTLTTGRDRLGEGHDNR